MTQIPTISHDLRREFGGAGFEGGQLGCGLELANHGRFDLHMLQNVQQGLSFAKAYKIVCVLEMDFMQKKTFIC